MYTDKDKQREATRERVRRYRALHKGVTEGVTSSPVAEGVTVTPEFMQGISKWVKLRGKANAVPLPANYVVDDKPVVDRSVDFDRSGTVIYPDRQGKPYPNGGIPIWRVEKDRQMAEFLKRHEKGNK